MEQLQIQVLLGSSGLLLLASLLLLSKLNAIETARRKHTRLPR